MRPSRSLRRVSCAACLASLLVSVPAAPHAQGNPRGDFLDALGRFSLALDGTFGDEAERLSSALDAMAAALSRWDASIQASEGGMAADVATADPRLASRMHVALAGVYLERGRVNDGLAQLTAARKADPARADAPLLEALAHAQLTGDDAAAVSALGAAHELDPQSLPLTYLLAHRLLTSNPQSARELLLRVQRPAGGSNAAASHGGTPLPFVTLDLVAERPGVEPFFPPVSYAKGFASLARGDLSQAVTQLRESLQRDPLTRIGNEEAVARAAAAFRQGDVEAARRHLQSFVSLSPKSADAHRLLGLVDLADGEEARGIAGLEAAVALDPADERTRVALADALLESGRHEDAERALSAALQALPSSGRLHYQLGLTHQRLGNRDGAVRQLEASLSARPLLGANTIHRMIGALHRDAQDFERAAASLSARVDVVPHDATAHRELAQVHFLQGDDEVARAELEIALLLDPADVEAHTLLAQLHLRQGRPAEAHEESRQALAIDPSHREARYVHATALIRMGHQDQGLAEMQTFQRLQAEDGESRARAFELGRLRREAAMSRERGDHAAAVDLLRRALVLDPRAASSHLDLGLALLQAGDPAAALERLTTAVALNAHFEVHRHLAEAYAALGEAESAGRERAMYERLRRESIARTGRAR